MGTHRFDVYEQLKFNLYQDDAATGEAAGIAMGLVELGSKSVAAIQVRKSSLTLALRVYVVYVNLVLL